MTKSRVQYNHYNVPKRVCGECGRTLPRMLFGIPDDWQLSWDELRWRERRILVAMMHDHRNNGPHRDFAEWTLMELSEQIGFMYRQTCNAISRLIPSRWVERTKIGRYRLPVETVLRLDSILPLDARPAQYNPVRTTKTFRKKKRLL